MKLYQSFIPSEGGDFQRRIFYKGDCRVDWDVGVSRNLRNEKPIG
jgi:hypothetical protein